MSETKEEKNPKFHAKSEENFHLWRLWMEAVFEYRDCMSILDEKEVEPEEDDEVTMRMYLKKKKRATALIVLALGDKPLKALQKYSKNPEDMWK